MEILDENNSHLDNSNDYSFLPDNAIASLSNAVLCISSNTTVVQRRLFYSCLAMFNNTDNEMMATISDFARQTKEEAIKHHLSNNNNNLNNFEFDDAQNLKLAVINFFAKYPQKRTFSFNFTELVEYWSDTKKPHSQYSAVKKAVNNILDIKFINEFTDKRGNKHIKRFNVFSYDDKIEAVDGTQTINLTLNIDFIPYLVFLNEIYKNVGYTKAPLLLLTNKKKESSFAILNMLLRVYRKDNDNQYQKIRMSIDTFRKYTDTQDKLKKFNDLKTKFIDVGVKELNSDDKINLKVSYIKRGRSYDKVVFELKLLDFTDDKRHKKEEIIDLF